jgi:hypothetical protein
MSCFNGDKLGVDAPPIVAVRKLHEGGVPSDSGSET